MKFIDMFFKVVVLVALSYLCFFVTTKMESISSDNAIINAALAEQSRQASRCALSALDQLETYVADMSKSGSAGDRLKADKMAKRMAAHQKAMAKQMN
jgi:hypothetical protein